MKYKWWVVFSAVVLLGLVILTWPGTRSKLIFCDVGQGDGMMIIKGSFQMLIDVGPDNKKMVSCLSKYMPFWDKNIEVVVISHWDTDHSGGLASVLRYYKVNKLYGNRRPEGADEQQIYTGNLEVYDVLRYGDIYFEVLSSESNSVNDNDGSIVGLLSYNDKSILMMGDVSSEVEQRLVWRGKLSKVGRDGGVFILKVSHHGSAKSSSNELLQLVRPGIAIISVGKDNQFGHPSIDVLKRLKTLEVVIKRTDELSDLVFY